MKTGVVFPAKLTGTVDGARIDAYCLLYFASKYTNSLNDSYICTRLNRLNGAQPVMSARIVNLLSLRPRLNWWHIGNVQLDKKGAFVIRDGTLFATVKLISITDSDYGKCVSFFERKEDEKKGVRKCGKYKLVLN